MRLGHRFIRSTAILLATALAACASQRSGTVEATYIVVRHAEKGNEEPSDPSLSAVGRARAAELARVVARTRLVAAYATPFKRTQQTAQPSATASGIAVTAYDASVPAADFASALRRRHPLGVTLVVGHSNTVPKIVAALCACSVTPMAEDEYDRLYEVTFAPDGRPRLLSRRY